MTPNVALDKDRLQHAAAVADFAVKSGSHPCVVVAAANREETLWSYIVSGEDRAEEDTVFLLASITKPVMATAIMQLVEQGKLLLSRPAAEYLPEFGAHGKQGVTARHLLTHTSGMDETLWITERAMQPGACFADACDTHLKFEPGTRCEYCTLSFAVLGELIAKIDGKSYPDYLRENLFAPLGMNATAFRPSDEKRAAPVHDFDPEALKGFVGRAIAGGGLWSAAADLVKFGQAFLCGGGSLLSPAAVEVMTRDHTGELSKQTFNYGLGWGKPNPYDSNPGSPGAFGHGGATGTLLWIDPAWDLVFVFLTNRWGVEQETPRRALNAVYGALRPKER
jgi:CubicO group peptidase (beta-lactamase class C family)